MVDLNQCFEAHSVRPYLVDAKTGRVVTYGEFAVMVRDLTAALQKAGLGQGARIATMVPNGVACAALYFACLASGMVFIPVNSKYPAEDRAFILTASRARYVACCSATAGQVPGRFGPAERIWLDDDAPADCLAAWSASAPLGGDSAAFCCGAGADALTSLTFTSGTTSRPKGIFHTRATLLTNAAAFASALGISTDHRFYHMMPMSYMAGLLNSLLCPFVAGASVVVDREFDASMAFSFWERPAGRGVNCMWSTPSALAMIMQMDRGTRGEAYAREHLRFVAACTAPLRPETGAAFEARYGVPVLPSFGMSETLINTIDLPKRRCSAGFTGHPLPGVGLEIRAEDGQPLPADATGELWVRSPSLMVGYMNPETGEPDPAGEDGWFPTGDVGELNAKGDLRISDRKKDLIIRGGVNISPSKVEEALCAHPGVMEAAVVGIADPVRGERIVAAVRLHVSQDPDNVTEEALRLCQERLERMAWPESIAVVDDFPRSSTGKVNKQMLRDLLGEPC